MPSTASATTTAMMISVRRGTTSVSGARGTGRAGRSGGGTTGQPELRGFPAAFAAPAPVPTAPGRVPALAPAPGPEADPALGAGGAAAVPVGPWAVDP